MHYLRIYENNTFSFVNDEIHTLNDSDVKVTNVDYMDFFKQQNEGKMFRLKESPTNDSLFGYIEEYEIEPVSKEKTLANLMNDLETQKSKLEALEVLIKEKLKE